MPEISLPTTAATTEHTESFIRCNKGVFLDSYLYLAEQFPMVPWIPVLQGWHAWQYEQHADMYERAGIVLADCGRVGLGSVCRRGGDTDIADLVTRLAARGYRLHGFGVSITGLRRIGHLLASSDSQAWSRTARTERIRLPGCRHHSRPDPAGVRHPTGCRNCFRYALHYREQVLDAVRLAATRARHDMAPLFELPAAARTMPARPTRAGAPRPGPADPGQLALFDPRRGPATRPAARPSRRYQPSRYRPPNRVTSPVDAVTSHRRRMAGNHPAEPGWGAPVNAATLLPRLPAGAGIDAVQLDLFGEVAARLAAGRPRPTAATPGGGCGPRSRPSSTGVRAPARTSGRACGAGGAARSSPTSCSSRSTTSWAGAPAATHGCGPACWPARSPTSARRNGPTGGTGSSLPTAPAARTRGACTAGTSAAVATTRTPAARPCCARGAPASAITRRPRPAPRPP